MNYNRPMQPPNRTAAGGGVSGVASAIALISTFFLTPALYSASVPFIREYAYANYGSGWDDVAGAGYFIVCVMIAYSLSRFLLSLVIAKVGFTLFQRF